MKPSTTDFFSVNFNVKILVSILLIWEVTPEQSWGLWNNDIPWTMAPIGLTSSNTTILHVQTLHRLDIAFLDKKILKLWAFRTFSVHFYKHVHCIYKPILPFSIPFLNKALFKILSKMNFFYIMFKPTVVKSLTL